MQIVLASKFFILVVFCSLAWSAAAKDIVLSDTAQEIRSKFLELRDKQDDTKLWEEYLKIFPHNKSEFKGIFDPEDFSELYHNSHEYIFILNNAPEAKRRDIPEMIISITKGGAPGCCDAWSALHRVAVAYAVQDILYFASLLKALEPLERQNVIKFLADKENHRSFAKYQVIIDEFKRLNKRELAQKFEDARTLRMKAKH